MNKYTTLLLGLLAPCLLQAQEDFCGDFHELIQYKKESDFEQIKGEQLKGGNNAFASKLIIDDTEQCYIKSANRNSFVCVIEHLEQETMLIHSFTYWKGKLEECLPEGWEVIDESTGLGAGQLTAADSTAKIQVTIAVEGAEDGNLFTGKMIDESIKTEEEREEERIAAGEESYHKYTIYFVLYDIPDKK